jgi:hypothetical protein
MESIIQSTNLEDSELVELEKSVISCLICTELAYEAFECSSCTALLCCRCYKEFTKTSKKCLLCRKDTLFKPSVAMRKVIFNLRVKCPLHCGKRHLNGEMKNHILNDHKNEEITASVYLMLSEKFNLKIYEGSQDWTKDFKYHIHQLEKAPTAVNWTCKGKILFKRTSCMQSDTDNNFVYRCNLCDYDICPDCVKENSAEFFDIGPYHQHKLKCINRDNGWRCDGKQAAVFGECKSGISGFFQSIGLKRFRCEQCDFDFCEKCLIFALSHI